MDTSLTHDQIEEIATSAAKKAVRETLLRLGVDEKEEGAFHDLRSDLAYMRRVRKASEQISKAGIWGIVGIIVSGVAAGMWVGLITILGGHHGGS